MSDNNQVTVKATHWFRGQEGEGDNGMVKPGDTLTVDKRRAAELRANKLVEGDNADQGASPAVSQPSASAPAPAAGPAPAKAATLTTETLTAKPAQTTAPEAKK